MNTTAINRNDPHKSVEERLRYLRTYWGYSLFGFLPYYIVTQVIGRPEGVEPNNTLFLVFLIISVAGVLISFPLKIWYLNRAGTQQGLERVKTAYIAAYALTDVGGLLGVIDFFITGDRYFYVLFVIAAIGHLFHFPQRQHFLNAGFESPST